MSNKIRLRKKSSNVKRHFSPAPNRQESGAAKLIKAALAFQRAGRFNEAAGCYRQVLAVEPDNPDANYLLGSLYYEHWNFDAALPLVEKAIQVKPAYADAYNLLGNIHHAAGRNEQAKRCFRQALQYEPRLAMAQNNLGLVLEAEGQMEAALDCYDKALKVDPHYAAAHANQGHVFRIMGRSDEAMVSYWRALTLNPRLPDVAANFSLLVKLNKALPASIAPAERRKVLTACLERDDIDGQKFFFACLHELITVEVRNEIQKLLVLADDREAFRRFLFMPPLAGLFSDRLFLLVLTKTRIIDSFAEQFLTALRRGLAGLIAGDILDPGLSERLLVLVCALARQSFWNEFVFQVTPAEEEFCAQVVGYLRQASLQTTPETLVRLALLACYAPMGTWDLGQAMPDDPSRVGLDFLALLRSQVQEVELERRLAMEMPTLGEIEDSVSRRVREQYEENPYPRWISITSCHPRPFSEWLSQTIAPNRPAGLIFSQRPQVLVAGGGSGKQPIDAAMTYFGSSVLSVDLSRASLAYAKRKAAEMGVANVDFLQGDILSIPTLGRTFDVIMCSGVLHHMDEPAKGLAALVECLRPGGYLNIGLYSELARQHIVAAREFVSAHGFAPTVAGIRASRQAIFALPDDHSAKKVIFNNDFYSTSTVRDLVFHVQELRFRLPEISRLLAEFNLEFLGFDLDLETKNDYLAKIGGDPGAISLEGWDRYERDHPDTFMGMYQFWVRKMEVASG